MSRNYISDKLGHSDELLGILPSLQPAATTGIRIGIVMVAVKDTIGTQGPIDLRGLVR